MNDMARQKTILAIDDDADFLDAVRDFFGDQPIVMVTANRDAKIAASCMAEGAYGYVPKPFELTYMDHIAATVMEQPAAR